MARVPDPRRSVGHLGRNPAPCLPTDRSGQPFKTATMRTDTDCRQMARLISDSLDRPAPPAEKARMRLHLVTCETCRIVEEQMGFLRRTVQQWGREQASRPGLPDNPRPPPHDQTRE